MVDTKISGLTEQTVVTPSTLFVTVDGGVNKKLTVANLQAGIVTGSAQITTQEITVEQFITFNVQGSLPSPSGGKGKSATGGDGNLYYINPSGTVYLLNIHALSMYDDGVFKASGSAISFGENLDVTVTGSTVFVDASAGTGAYIAIASQHGAALNTDLDLGGGTDDTAALQAILNLASGSSSSVLLIMDGPALVTGLDVYSNTTIYCMEGAGFYLADNSDREIIRNAHRSRTTITDQYISLVGGYYNGNHPGQNGVGSTGHQQTDNTFMNGISLFGVNFVTIRDIVMVNTMAFGINLANGNYFTIENYVFERGSDPHVNQDGLHLNGPLYLIHASNLKLRSYDDALAVNAGDDTTVDLTAPGPYQNIHGPYIGQGDITDLIVDGMEFVDCLSGIRLLSHDANSRIDRVNIRNVAGTYKDQAVIASSYGAGAGDFGSVTIDGFNVLSTTPVSATPCMMQFDSEFESLTLRNINVHMPPDDRPLIWFHSTGSYTNVEIDGFNIYDTDNNANGMIPIKIDGRVSRLRCSRLNWVRLGVSQAQAFLYYNYANSETDALILNGVQANLCNHIVDHNGGTIGYIQASNIRHEDTGGNASFDTVDIINKITLSNWYGTDPINGIFTETEGDAFLTSITLDSLSDVDTTGVETGDIIYNNAGTWNEYPLGIGINVVHTTGFLKLGSVTGSYTRINDANGKILLVGSARQYRDSSVPLMDSTIVSGTSHITVDNVEGAVSFDDQCVIGNYVFVNMKLQHDWSIGTNIQPQLHWFQSSSDVPNWLFQYRWQIQGATKTTAWTNLPYIGHIFTYATGTLNQITDFGPISAPVGASLSDIIQFRVIRDTDNGSDEFAGVDPLTGNALALDFGLHYLVDGFGSEEGYIKGTSDYLFDSDSEYILDDNDVYLTDSGG